MRPYLEKTLHKNGLGRVDQGGGLSSNPSTTKKKKGSFLLSQLLVRDLINHPVESTTKHPHVVIQEQSGSFQVYFQQHAIDTLTNLTLIYMNSPLSTTLRFFKTLPTMTPDPNPDQGLIRTHLKLLIIFIVSPTSCEHSYISPQIFFSNIFSSCSL
jgi:hypothetical protein